MNVNIICEYNNVWINEGYLTQTDQTLLDLSQLSTFFYPELQVGKKVKIHNEGARRSAPIATIFKGQYKLG